MPNPNKMTKAEREKAEKNELGSKLVYQLFNRNEAYTGELLALLGQLASGNNSLSELAEDVLEHFYMPLSDKKNPTPDYHYLQEARTKLGKFKARFFNLPGMKIREQEKSVHSDDYIQEQLLTDPQLQAYYYGLQQAEFRCQMNAKHRLYDENAELIYNYENEGKEDIYQVEVTFDGEEAYKRLTPEEKEAFRVQYNDYYRQQYHEECLADTLLADEENWPIPGSERAELQRRMGINWQVQWKKNWVSYKPDRRTYEHWKSGELTKEEWDTIEKNYKSEIYDIDAAFADPDAPQENLWDAEWEKNKEAYRKRYFEDIWAPKWVKEWETKHKEKWHPAPEFTEADKESEDDDWYDSWTRPDDEDFFKKCWLDNWTNSMRRMDSFFNYQDKPMADGSADYETRQNLLKQAEKQVKQQDRQAEEAGLSPQQITALHRQKEDSEKLTRYDYSFKVFTELDFSYLSTKEYMALQKAAVEAVSSTANPRNAGKSFKRWVPNEKAHSSLLQMIPIIDKIDNDLEYYATDVANDPKEYNKVMQNVKGIQKSLKQGSSDANLQVLLSRLMLNDHDCQDYLEKYPKRFFLFNWNRNSRYNQVKKLRKECRKQITALKDIMEKNGRAKTMTERAVAANHTRAQEAVEALQNAPKNIINNANRADYEKRQSQIKEGVELIHKIQQERNSLSKEAENRKVADNTNVHKKAEEVKVLSRPN